MCLTSFLLKETGPDSAQYWNTELTSLRDKGGFRPEAETQVHTEALY